MSSHLNHDTAARLLDLTPGELTGLVNRGVIPRADKNAYNLGPLVHAYIRHLREEQIRIDQRPTQAEIAAHLDISDRRLRELLTEFGLDHKQSPLTEIRILYLRKLRAEAAGRSTNGDLDLATERARLAAEQADKIAMQNAVTRGELAPAALIEEVLTKAAARIAGVFDAIPGMVRRRVPELRSEEIDLIAGEVAKARNVVAAMSLADLSDDPADKLEVETQVVDA